jgi:hypothetical protein
MSRLARLRLPFPRVALFTPFVLGALVTGCAAIPIHLHTETHVQSADGTVEHRSSDWEGTLDQLPAQLGKAGAELGDVTAKLAKQLTEVPPPGEVDLAELSPELARFKGQRGADFLVSAKDAEGKPIRFQYVRLGVAAYDDFFRTAQELYALVYQATQVVSQMRQLSGKLLDAKVDASANLSASVDRALGLKGQADASLVTSLEGMRDMGRALAALLPRLGGKVTDLVAQGQALVTQAPTSLTNPKVVANLDLVKKGLLGSVSVLKESGGLAVSLGKDLAGFKG